MNTLQINMYNQKRTKMLKFTYLLLFMLCCVPFFTPEGLGFTGASKILVLFKQVQALEVVLLILYEICFYFKHILSLKKPQYRKRFIMFCCVAMLSFLQVFSTVINHGDISTALQRIYILLGTYLIVENLILSNAEIAIKGFTYIFMVACIINLIVIILLYGRMGFRIQGDFWFFGQKNAMRNIVIPAITFSAMLDRIQRKKFSVRTLFLTGTGILALVLVNSGASISIIAVFAALLLYLNVTDYELLDLKKLCILYIILEILIVFLRRMDLFKGVIEGVLNRDVTLTNRTLIWDKTLSIINDNLIFGDGLRLLEDSKLVIGSFRASHAHNALLDIILKCGILGAIWLILIVYRCMKQQFKMKSSALGAILGMTVGTFLIAGLVGELWNFGFFLVLFCMFYLPEVTVQIEDSSIAYTRKHHLRFKLR